jgi:hypothetical protein
LWRRFHLIVEFSGVDRLTLHYLVLKVYLDARPLLVIPEQRVEGLMFRDHRDIKSYDTEYRMFTFCMAIVVLVEKMYRQFEKGAD